MAHKKAPQNRDFALNVDNHKRLANALFLLVTVERRVKEQKRKKRKTKYAKKEKRVRINCEPCFIGTRFTLLANTSMNIFIIS